MSESALLPVYRRSPIRMVRGEGVYLYDEDDKPYLDFAAGIAVNSLGHCHPYLVRALQEQAGTLWHTSNMYTSSQQERLARRLADHSFADAVFFCSTGVEAVECCFKMIRKYHDETGNPDRFRTIVVEGGFHGRSLTAISAVNKEKTMKGFEPVVDGFDQVPFDDLAAVERAIGPQTGAILLEPIQGEGGIRVADMAFLHGLRKLADQHGLLLFFDEVQCGMARTGTMFYYEQCGIEPDIMSVAKGIGSGFPLGAALATEKVAKTMTPGSHGSTYGGNALAMSVGNAVMDLLLEAGFNDRVRFMGDALKAALQEVVDAYPDVLDSVRGVGLMLGIVTKVPNTDMANTLRKHGLLTAPASDNVLRIMPPLIIEQEHLDEAARLLRAACEECRG